jgi:glycosyltransferase involved in cell wall biosynthesis
MVVRPLRIAHITATFPPHLTGTGLVCFHNARELARRGHDVHVYTAKLAGAPSEEKLDGFQVHRLKPVIKVGNAPFIPGLVTLSQFDVVHLHYPFFGGEGAALATRIRNIPLLITYHQDVHLSGWMGIVEKGLRHTLERWVLRSASKVLFTSLDYSMFSYARKLLRGCEQKISVVHNGVDVRYFTPGDGDEELAKEADTKASCAVVLLVAGLDRAHFFKGVPQYLLALAQLKPEIQGVIVGEGELRNDYQRQSDQLGLGKRVHFAGHVSTDSLLNYYRLADIVVLPSITMGEAFGLVLLEAMACGRPVIASDLPGVRTIINEGVDGSLVKPGDPADLAAKIARLLDLPNAKRKAMGAAGRSKVIQNYTWELAGERLETIYQQVVFDHAELFSPGTAAK